MSKKYVYSFDEGKTEMKNLLGGKGANLAEMTSLGVPVPPGFTITTETCIDYLANNNTFPKGTMDQVKKALEDLEAKMGKKLGDHVDPLLVSVRSGARVSMPGMMDTVLNLGLNDMAVIGLAKIAEDERFAYDSYRRLIMMFADVVKYQERKKYDELLDKIPQRIGILQSRELVQKFELEQNLLDVG